MHDTYEYERFEIADDLKRISLFVTEHQDVLISEY